MKCIISLLVIFGTVLIICDPTRATPLSRVRRQGWAWGGESDSNEQIPVRPTRPTRPPRPTQAPTAAPNVDPDPNASTTTVVPQSLRNCMASCPTTQQYNPVCGSNRVTYDNLNKLNCARNCGVGVDLLFNGTCQPVTR